MWTNCFRALVLATIVLSPAGGCSGGCSNLEPLAAPVPADQTVEGGVQIRVTQTGFETLTALVPALVNASISDGFCIAGPFGAVGVDLCGSPDCAGGATGCRVDVTLDSLVMSVPDDQTFRIDATFDVASNVPVDAGWLGSCSLDVTLDNGRVVADIGFSIDPATGELRMQLNSIDTFDISGVGISGCGVLGSILDGVVGFVADLISSSLGGFIIDALTPVIDGFIQGLLPSPLGIEGMLDMGAMLAGISPGIDAKMETRAVAGGYVSLPASGLSLGMIVGLNSDRDTTTREATLDNEPNLCVPPRGAPDYTGLLPIVPGRNTFALQPAEEFLGAPDPAADLAIGVSQTVFDLAGHHIVSSGAMCLAVGSSLVSQLNLGTIGILVPSLSELGGGTGKEPIMLVLRPQNALTFDIGEGTDTDPRLTIHIKDMEVDFYAFLMERYVRGFTISLTMDAGINLEFVLDDMGNPAIQPTLVGIESDAILIEVLNAEFLREDPAQLEAVFPTLFDLVLPLLSDGLAPIALPEFSGFELSNLQTDKVVTSEDDFLAIYASLAPSSGKRAQIVQGAKWLAPGVVERAQPVSAYTPVETTGQVLEVITPTAYRIREGIIAGDDSTLPSIALELGGDCLGATCEWQWRLNGGMWREYSGDPRPVLQDPAFAIQGRHLIEVRARAIGDFRTYDRTPLELPVVIDSVGPKLLLDRTERDGDDVVFVATDLVSEDAELTFAFGSTDAFAVTGWRDHGRISIDEIDAVIGSTGVLIVSVRDGLGNESRVAVERDAIGGFHGRTPSSGGCSCDTTSSDPAAGTLATLLGLAVVMLAGFASVRRRALLAIRYASRAGRFLPVLAVVVAAGFMPACNCGGKPGGDACLVDEDCAATCGDKLAMCIDGECFCADDIAIGEIGQYQDLGVSASTGDIWVSAYNRTHGDLMVAKVIGPGRVPDDDWQFVDGVPDGPVVLPQSMVRGGIRAAGDDVGVWTSIAVTPANEPVVSYFDVSNGSLRFAGFFGGVWKTMVVDAGIFIQDPELGGEEVGRYSSITVGADGLPAIAYLALVYEGGGVGRTELRYARAMIPQPTGMTDWSLWIVDQTPLPPPPADGSEPPFNLIEGVGLFVAQTLMPDGSPVLAYYDRPNGDLKVATFANNIFNPPTVVDGADGSDVGMYPSIVVSADGVVHLSYVDASRDNLLYINLTDNLPTVIDDGYRIDGMTEDGLPKPVFHLVGDDSNLVSIGSFMAVAYQDATNHELLLATRNPADGTWAHITIAGADDPFVGGYGFYAAAEAAFTGEDLIMSTYVIDQPQSDSWVEVFNAPIVVQ